MPLIMKKTGIYLKQTLCVKHIFAGLLLFFSFAAFAHPHSFVDVQATVKTDAKGIKQIDFLWIQNSPFGDDMFQYEPRKYIEWCREWMDEHILNDNYCCSIFVNNRKIQADKFTLNQVKLLQKENQIKFYITLDLSIPVKAEPCTVDIVMEDKDYYVAFYWLGDKVTFTGDKKLVRGIKFVNDNQTLQFCLAPPGCEINKVKVTSGASVSGRWLPGNFLKQQADWNRKIHNYLQTLKTKFSWTIFLLLFGAALAYGMFHAAGPGHGKGLIAAYFLSGGHSIFDVFKITLLITLLHTGTAFLLILVFYFSMSFVSPNMRVKVQAYLSFIMALGIIVLGCLMLVYSFKRKDDRPVSLHCRKIIFFAGVFPCPQSIAIMLGCMAAGIWRIGVCLVLGISIGTFAVLLTIAIICHCSSRPIPYFMEKRKINHKYPRYVLEWVKCALIIFSGLILAALNWPG